MQGTNNPFYSSQAWRDARAECRRRAGNRCEQCGNPCHANGRVDHRVPISERPDLALVQSNLRLLCPTCDNRRHAEKGGGRALLRGVDARGLPMSPSHHWNANDSHRAGVGGGESENLTDGVRSCAQS